MKRKTYWWARDGDDAGWYYLYCKKPKYDKQSELYQGVHMEEFCPTELEMLCPSAKLKPGQCVEIEGFKIIKKKEGSD